MTKKISAALLFLLTGLTGVFPQYGRNQYQYVFKNNSDYPVTVFHTPVEYGMGNYRKLGIVNPGAEQVYPSLMNPLYDGQCNFRYEYDSDRVAHTEKNEYTPYPVNGNAHIQVNVTFSNKMSGQQSAAPTPAPAPPPAVPDFLTRPVLSAPALQMGLYSLIGGRLNMDIHRLGGGNFFVLYENGSGDKALARGSFTVQGSTISFTCENSEASSPGLRGKTRAYIVSLLAIS